ncbi:MAG: hypothetical protein IT580_11995 [Verrucomicrobiales bacterium]|nr:hypothetical protein [Verrucomicrobiales bacterium]
MLGMALLAVALGLHWAVLQTVAWTRMVLEFSQTAPLPVALSMTFDGRHGCSLCRVIERGRRAEQESSPIVSRVGPRLESDLPVDPPAFCLDGTPACGHAWIQEGASRVEDPPKPRPRRGWIV